MNSNSHQATAFPRNAVLVFILFLVATSGCKKDEDPAGPSPVPIYPSVAGHYVGSAHLDYGVGFQDLSVTGDISQTLDSLKGSMVWIITTAGSLYRGYTTTVSIKGTVTLLGAIAFQEVSAVNLNNDWSLRVWNGKLSAKGDTLSFANVLTPPERYPIGTLVIAKK